MTKIFQEPVQIMKILSNQSRLEILYQIAKSPEDLCVSQLSEKVGISQSLASHQLAYLSSHKIVRGYRMGQTVCYKSSETLFAQKVFEIIQFLIK
jgi:DNA-binding transcriptional ArsR family regulator